MSKRVSLKPKAGHCIKTILQQNNASTDNRKKVFVNIAFDDAVPSPPEGSADAIQRAMRGEDASDSQWFVPVVVSDPREDVDKAGKPCLVFDCIFNSGVKSLSLRDPLFKTYIQELSLQRIEAQTSLLLSREITTPNIASKGKLLPRTALIPDTLPPPTKPLIEEIPPVPPPKGILKPSTQSLPLPVTTWSWSKMPESGTIEISFPVPLLTRALISRTTVDIEARRVLVFVPSSPPLSIDVNVDVSDAEITARVPGHEAALMLKRERAFNVEAAQVEWRVANKVLVVRC